MSLIIYFMLVFSKSVTLKSLWYIQRRSGWTFRIVYLILEDRMT